ncbi:MAG: polysaccharide deacetylase family protein [bacterium]
MTPPPLKFKAYVFLASFLFFTGISWSAEKQGGIVIQFDDGWSSWATLIAPELKKAGGVATCFVNNQNLRSGRITLEDLLALQNTYGWEVGTHTWHHLNSPAFVRKNGIDRWLNEEFNKSVSELRAAGLTINSMVFPFNMFDKKLTETVQPLVETYRRTERLSLATGVSADKSVPGTAMDMAHYVPVDLLKQWIDMAADRNKLLFLYGHRILPDSDFATGTVVSVTSTTLTAAVAVTLPQGTDLVLAPDVTRRAITDFFNIVKVTGTVIEVDRADLAANTRPGAQFLIGEAYSTRLSDFRSLVEYAASKVNFYTLHDVASGKPSDSYKLRPNAR